MKRKILTIILSLLLVFVAVGCENKTQRRKTVRFGETETNTTSSKTSSSSSTTSSNRTSSNTTRSNSTTSSSSSSTSYTITYVSGGYYLDNFPYKTFATDTISVSKIRSYYKDFNFTTQTISTLNKFLKDTATGLNSQSYDKLRQTLLQADQVPGNTSKIRLFYSHDIVNAKWDNGNTWNREHVYAKSVGDFANGDIPSQDLHHIRPTYTGVNRTRGNDPFGLVSNRNSYKVIADIGTTVSGYSNGGVFEPIDEVKGDVARIIFYTCAMYYQQYSINLLKMIASKDVQLFLKWNREDPVDEYEINRNNVAQGIQGNRNRFIDFPEYAEFIWG
ncbi:MAG: endonuclease [Gammaproteobacteria bacterium]|nr:endonuclease [Gammaproteobacteria bacterium]